MIFEKGERCCTLLYYKRTFFIKALKYRRFSNVRIIIRWHKKSTDFRCFIFCALVLILPVFFYGKFHVVVKLLIL